MPAEAIKNLPAAAKRVYESAYADYKAKGFSDERAGKAAWGAVKKNWRKNAEGNWVKMESLLLTGGATGMFAELQASEGEPQLFRKALTRVGKWVHPQDATRSFVVTADRVQNWLKNFEAGRPDLVTVPIGHKGYDDALKNTGYLRKASFDGHTVWGDIEFTREDARSLARSGSIPAASIAIAEHWIDSETGEDHGEAIIHVALTQRPHIQALGGFQAIQHEMGDPTCLQRAEGSHSEQFALDAGATVAHIENLIAMLEEQGVQLEVTADGTNDTEGSMKIEQKKKDADAEEDEGKSGNGDGDGKDKGKGSGVTITAEAAELLVAKVTELETKLASVDTRSRAAEKRATDTQATLDAERSDRLDAEDQVVITQLCGGKVEGAKFGLPVDKQTKSALATILGATRSGVIELEGGVKVAPRQFVITLLEGLTKTGLIPLADIVDVTEAEGDEDDGRKTGSTFLERQAAREGIDVQPRKKGPGQSDSDKGKGKGKEGDDEA